jgi:hypothetical protein
MKSVLRLGIIGIEPTIIIPRLTRWHTSLTEVVITNKSRYIDRTLLSNISAWTFMLKVMWILGCKIIIDVQICCLGFL